MTALMLCSAYLVGAIPAGFLLYKKIGKADIRETGSRNIGATNVLRTAGWKVAVPVLLFDIGKGLLPVLLAKRWFDSPWIAGAAGLAAILGHCFPVYIRFRGGKGVSTTLGALSGLAWLPLLCSLGFFLMVIVLSRYVSLSSLTALAAFPLLAALFKAGPEVVSGGILIFVLVTFQHRENIRRLIKGEENKLGEKR